MSNPMILIAAPADAPLTSPGSTFTHQCGKCGRRVMVAPTGQRLLREQPGTSIVCLPCFLADPPKNLEFRPAGSTEEIRREVASAVPNQWRVRN